MIVDFTSQIIAEKENKTLNKPFRTPGGPKKFSVYVKNEKGNVVKVNFGDPNMEIKRDDPNRRKNFRARHNCDNPGPKTKARYWSCKMWSKKSVTQMTKGSHPGYDWDGETIFDLEELIETNPALAFVEEEVTEEEDDCGCGGCGCKETEAADDTEYDMTLEEYDEVMDLEDAVAARPGRKSGAQTPAKPSERKKGSSKNKPGSAGKSGSAITFSEKVINSLKNKVKEHNSKSKKKVTLGQLKKVYRRGAGAFSQSHRPGMTRGGWAMARVNMFLKMKRGGKVKDSYRKADGDI
tara:strand:+ start:2122 stop:3003 length:882 start_codon:yes stop_codon:yes gene_type:complete